MSLTSEQLSQLREYLETILELYTSDEYEEFVEDIVINYCNTRFGLAEEESKKLFYKILNEINGEIIISNINHHISWVFC